MSETRTDTWRLARLAGCTDPDSHESPGAIFLADVAQAVEYVDASDDPTDEASRIADEAVYAVESRGTYRKWLAFVDLAAWQEDIDEWGPFDDLNRAADLALYAIAERLATALLAEHDDDDDDDDDDDGAS